MGMPVLSFVGGPSNGLGSALLGVGSISWGLGGALGLRSDLVGSHVKERHPVDRRVISQGSANEAEETRLQIALEVVSKPTVPPALGASRRTSKSLLGSKAAPRATWNRARMIFRISATIAFFLRLGA